jgi:hypothetical protein
MDDQFSVPFLSGFFFGGICMTLAVRHGWQDSFALCMILVAGTIVGFFAMVFIERPGWYDEQRNLATRHRKLIVGLLFCAALLQSTVGPGLAGFVN